MAGNFVGINIYDPWELAGLISAKPRQSRFLSKRYGNVDEVEITEGKRVAVDYEFESTQIAPYVTDNSTGLALGTDGYGTLEIDVPNVGVKKNLSKKELEKRLPGEDPANPFDIPTRAQKNIEKFSEKLETAIAAREELQVAEVLSTNGLKIEERDDKTGNIINSYNIDYLAPLDSTTSSLNARQKALMAQAKARAVCACSDWSTSSLVEIIQECDGVLQKYAEAGIVLTEILVSPKIWTKLQSNEKFITPFQNAMYASQFGDLNGEDLGDPNAAVVAHLKVRGRTIKIIVFDGTYVDNDG